MRAITLTMKAFGPYAGETVIQFDGLGESGIYMITGETGAGKTSIFDGISFALFGAASGDNRENRSLRSKYASDDTETYVELKFAYRGKEYIVKRNPEYYVLSRRTGTLVKRAPDAELILPDGSVVVKTGAVDAKIKELLGVDRGQFNRIAMLPQGEFLKLLLAKTEERILIFRKIFKTEKFNVLQDKIGSEFSACEAERRKLEAERETLLRESGREEELANATEEEACEILKNKVLLERDEYHKAKKEKEGAQARSVALGERWGVIGEAKKAASNLSDTRKELDSFSEALAKEKKKAEEFQEEKPHFDAIKNEIAAHVAKMDDYKEREALTDRIAQAEKEAVRAQAESVAIEGKLRSLKEMRERKQAEWSSCKSLEATRAKKKSEEEALQKEIKEIALCFAIAEENAADQEKLTEKKKGAEALCKAYQEAGKRYVEENGKFLRNRAGLFAEALREGEPCPVCGSTHHPVKAKKENGVLSESEVEALRLALEEKEQKFREECAAIEREETRLITEKKNVTERLFSLTGEDDFAACRKIYEARSLQAKELSNELYQLNDSITKAKSLEGEIAKANEQEERLLKAKSEFEKKASDAVAEGNAAKERKQALKSLRFSNLRELKEALGAWRKQVDDFERAEKENKESCDGLTEKVKTLQGKEKALEEAAKGYSLEEYERIRSQMETVKEEIRALDEKIKEITERGTRTKAACQKLEEIRAHEAEVLKRWQILSPLNDTANGRTSGKEKIRLETYVQMQYFDRVVASANRRLKKMTEGRYELIRRESGTTLNRQVGLELDVIDHTNDTTREASTLSGGESFMAALSLALGLSDEIQKGAGGVKIDSMFVDEGFGSLSDEALDAAIDTLVNVSGGNVLIGIISHVDQLRERIDKQIVVTKGKNGSEVKIVV